MSFAQLFATERCPLAGFHYNAFDSNVIIFKEVTFLKCFVLITCILQTVVWIYAFQAYDINKYFLHSVASSVECSVIRLKSSDAINCKNFDWQNHCS